MINRFSKSILILAAAGLLGAGSVYAGNGPGDGSCVGDADGTCTGEGSGQMAGGDRSQQRRGGPAEQVAGMANRFGLSLDQQSQALYLFDKHAQERADLQAAIFLEFGEDICAMRESHQAELHAMLSPEQQAQHDQMQQKRANRGNRAGGGFGSLDCSVYETD